MTNNFLSNELSTLIKHKVFNVEIPDIIKNNLNPKFEIRPYQKEAFARFDYYIEKYPQKTSPIQQLFHMATGSGKTLIMAGLVLYLYQKGYRNFLFFVNSKTIIEKTKDNFLNPSSSKYLFNENIVIDYQKITFKEVKNFEGVSEDNSINILFKATQGLQSDLNKPSENSISYEDFENKKIVLLSDETHHLQRDTKQSKNNLDEKTWESTVYKIFTANQENILLEFTATIDLEDGNIKDKYKDKILFDYPLKQFRIDKYSKEVKVLQADMDPIERALQACILNQYRRKIFEKHQINIKPVLLLKSKGITESEKNFKTFIQSIKNLNDSTIEKIKNNSKGAIKSAFEYFEKKKITTNNLITELKGDFSEEKCLSINSKNDSEEKQMIVNSLEDDSNEHRVIFAVNQLNEGWDVLNLFDIVRLYDTRDSKNNKIGKTTMSEAQLIGRGARYCPFRVDKNQSLYQRKYDDDIKNELRICEELYYHSAHNPKYITELNKALKEIGIKADNVREVKLSLKDSFLKTDFYKKSYIFVNKRQKNDKNNINQLDQSIRNKRYKKTLKTGDSSELNIFEKNDGIPIPDRESVPLEIKNFGDRVIRKAMDKLPFYSFKNLKEHFPNLKSLNEFITSKKYLSDIKVEIEGEQAVIDNINKHPKIKLETVLFVLEEISKNIRENIVEYVGSEKFYNKKIKEIFTNETKTRNLSLNENSSAERGVAQSKTTNENLLIDLSEEDWYVFNDNYGTSQEKYFVKYIKQIYENFKRKYNEVYLIRNENHFKLYDFSTGNPFEPDFVLFLKKKETDNSVIYQMFIEPKGEHLLEHDKWKEDFLKRISENFEIKTLLENEEFKIIGMPFYNFNENSNQSKKDFTEKMNEYS